MKLFKIFLNKLKWVFVANIYSSLSKFLILIVIAQFTTATEVGIYTLGLAITAPITLLFNMKMKSIIITENNPKILMFKNIRLISNIFALSLIIVTSYIFYNEYILVILLIGLTKILDINSEFYQSLPNKNKEFHVTSKLIVSKYSLITIAFVITIILTNSLIIGLLIYIIVQYSHLFIEKNVFNKYIEKHKRNDENYLSVLSFMIPLGITQMLYSFGSSLPKYFLEILGTIEDVGVFSAILYFVTVINMLMSSIFQTILPYGMNIYYENNNKFNNFIFKYIPGLLFVFCLFLYIPVFFWGKDILNIMYGEIYSEHYDLLYILIIAVYFNMMGWLFDSALLISRNIKLQPLLTLFNISITAFFGWFLINSNALIGATITVTIYSFLNFLYKFGYYYLQKRRRT